MSWFFGSTPSPANSTSQTSSGDYKPLSRNERTKCWEARDIYFSCLDKHDILDATTKEGAAKSKELCSAQEGKYEQDCASSWVKYFKQKRVADFDKAQRIKKLEGEGAVPMDQAQKPAWKFW